MKDSRISEFYKLNTGERIAELQRLGVLTRSAAEELRQGRGVLSTSAANCMIENVIGVFGLPFAVAPNFIVNDRDCIVPLAVEEPSIVAGLSGAAALARMTGGFTSRMDESLLAGQIHITGITDLDEAVRQLEASTHNILVAANAVHPRLLQRGGGVREINVRRLHLADGVPLVVVHVLVDTCDAMGANLVNTICESIAPLVVSICGGEVALRILSNLTDRSLCHSSVRFTTASLASESMAGDTVRDRIVLASEIALADSHRAATHNKGVMNGIDAVAIATGNDWRAIEAGAHAFAVRDGRYTSLTKWTVADNGDLHGEITVPLKPGIVGGTVSANKTAALGLALCGATSALQLAELMAAVGLAQNFAALRALATSGIQKGHMHLHARSLAAAAGAHSDQVEEVAEKLVASGEVKDWNAVRIVGELQPPSEQLTDAKTAAGKIILLGEHAVVYGKHAVAVPIADAVAASASFAKDATTIRIREWGINRQLCPGSQDGLDRVLERILERLHLADRSFIIDISSRLPRGMGLGSSAAFAVAVTRAVAACVKQEICNNDVNAIAFSCEQVTHGTPSGIDNSVSCFAKPILFKNAGTPQIDVLSVLEKPPLLIGFSHQSGPTHEQVAAVRRRREVNPEHYDAVFDQIDSVSLAGADALTAARYDELGAMMNICQGLLNAIEVSTSELEHMVAIARRSGAVGAKLTGAGGGGAIVALCPGVRADVEAALNKAGYRTL